MVNFIILGRDKEIFVHIKNILKVDCQVIYAESTLKKKWYPLLKLENTICIGELEDLIFEDEIKAMVVIRDDLISNDLKKRKLKNILSDKRIAGIMDKNLSCSLYTPFLMRLIDLLLVKENAGYQEKKSKLLEDNLLMLEKLKKIHSSIIPLREDHFKNIKVASKYIPGMKSGGEFFDILQKDGKMIIFLSSTSSHADSSIILSLFEKLHQDKESSEDFTKKFISIFKEKTTSYPWKSFKGVQLFLMQIDCISLLAYGYNFGDTEIASNINKILSGNQLLIEEKNFEKARFEIDIAKIKDMMIISPGLKKNYKEYYDEDTLYKIILEKRKRSNEYLAFEVFYMLKKDKEDDFLDYDASLFLMEIGKDV